MPVFLSKDMRVCVCVRVNKGHFSTLIIKTLHLCIHTSAQTRQTRHISQPQVTLDPVEGRCGHEADCMCVFPYASMCVHVTACVRAILLNSHKDTASYMTPSCVDLAY